MTGTVIRVLLNKGYAFIRDEDGMSRFAHANSFRPLTLFDTLYEGQHVEFEPTSVEQGRGNSLRAEEVRACSNSKGR